MATQPADAAPARKPLGELLKEKGLITEEYIGLALQDQRVTRERVGEILERLGFVSQYDVAQTISEQEGREYVDVEASAPSEQTLRLFNLNVCLNNLFLPLRHGDGRVEVATANSDVESLERLLGRQTGLQPIIYQGEKGKIANAVQHYYYFLDNPVESLLDREIKSLSADREEVRSPENLISYLLQYAVKKRASDIHIRPMDQSINIAFRIDGVMQPMFSLPPNLRRVVAALKMKSEMDIAEQRLPQDGSFSANILNTSYELRSSTVVVPYGENMVMRLLPMRSDFLGLRQLGFFEDDMDLIRRIFNEPYGIVLLTGPTGSGKSTTLYAAVRTLNLVEKNVITVENPIEYRIPLVRQTQVNVKANYTFANAIRYFLRHDPDVIMVGEIRDQETATTAMSASETGHLVLSTLHTNTAIGVIPRLRSLGVPSFQIAEALAGVVSQRLVRRICPNCKEAYEPTEAERSYLGHPEDLTTLYRGNGCEACGNTGYLGRTLVYEVLKPDQDLSIRISREDGIDSLIDATEQLPNFRPIFNTAVRKVVLGETSVPEMQRVMGS